MTVTANLVTRGPWTMLFSSANPAKMVIEVIDRHVLYDEIERHRTMREDSPGEWVTSRMEYLSGSARFASAEDVAAFLNSGEPS